MCGYTCYVYGCECRPVNVMLVCRGHRTAFGSQFSSSTLLRRGLSSCLSSYFRLVGPWTLRQILSPHSVGMLGLQVWLINLGFSWAPGIKFRPLTYAANAFRHGAISLARELCSWSSFPCSCICTLLIYCARMMFSLHRKLFGFLWFGNSEVVVKWKG